MTNKQKLLDYCELNLDDATNILRVDTIIYETQQCSMSISTSKSRTMEIIRTNFNDELVGSMPNDFVVHQICKWDIIPLK